MTVQGLGVTTTTGQSGGVTNSFGGTSSATPLTAGRGGFNDLGQSGSHRARKSCRSSSQTASRDVSLDSYPRTPSASFDPNTCLGHFAYRAV
mgnify:CR=1 FL=1